MSISFSYPGAAQYPFSVAFAEEMATSGTLAFV